MPTPKTNIPADSLLKYELDGEQSIITGNSPVPNDHGESLLQIFQKIEELSHSNWLVHPLGRMIITALILNTIIIVVLVTKDFGMFCAPLFLVYILFFFFLGSMGKLRKQGAASMTRSTRLQPASWELTISSSQIRYHYGTHSQKADEKVINTQDIKSFTISPEGFLSAELISSQSVKTLSANITGTISPQDQEWLLEHCSHHISKPAAEEQSYSQPIKVKEAGPAPNDLKIIQDTPSSLNLTKSPSLGYRIFTLVVSAVAALIVYPFFRDNIIPIFFKKTQSIAEFLDKSPLHWKFITAFCLIIIPCFIVFFIIWKILGKTHIQANGQGITVSRKALGIGASHNIPVTQIKSLKQISWTERSSNNNSRRKTKYWNLEIDGNKTITILDKSQTHSFETVDWLGRRLSEILAIRYTRAYEDDPT